MQQAYEVVRSHAFENTSHTEAIFFGHFAVLNQLEPITYFRDIHAYGRIVT